MKITYVARHGVHGNADEDAVGWALEQLGHEVVRVDEARAYETTCGAMGKGSDFVLFHKWAGANVQVAAPKVFWHFDRVASDPDERGTMLERWTAERRRWMARTMEDPELLCGFCTDGDWVAQDQSGKLTWLTQGFDERQAGTGTFRPELARDVVFFGTATRNGHRRRRCLEALRGRYGNRLWVHNKETRGTSIHGRELADLCVSAKVIVAPDGPCSDRYWSNRIYLVTGLGGCLVHPLLDGLVEQYSDTLAFWYNESGLFSWINILLQQPAQRDSLRVASRNRTMARHTYKHRCETLVEEVRRRLGK